MYSVQDGGSNIFMNLPNEIIHCEFGPVSLSRKWFSVSAAVRSCAPEIVRSFHSLEDDLAIIRTGG